MAPRTRSKGGKLPDQSDKKAKSSKTVKSSKITKPEKSKTSVKESTKRGRPVSKKTKTIPPPDFSDNSDPAEINAAPEGNRLYTGRAQLGRKQAESSPALTTKVEARYDLERKAKDLLTDLSWLHTELKVEGHTHGVFFMVAAHLEVARVVLNDIVAYPGSWPSGKDGLASDYWWERVREAYRHAQESCAAEGFRIVIPSSDPGPLWTGVGVGFDEQIEAQRDEQMMNEIFRKDKANEREEWFRKRGFKKVFRPA